MPGAIELRLAAVGSSVKCCELANGLSIRHNILVMDMLDEGVVVRKVATDKAMRLHDDNRAA
eukprot:5524986-Pleurochrysis_carterae.AAC.2